jgi:hypothetical protein
MATLRNLVMKLNIGIIRRFIIQPFRAMLIMGLNYSTYLLVSEHYTTKKCFISYAGPLLRDREPFFRVCNMTLTAETAQHTPSRLHLRVSLALHF